MGKFAVKGDGCQATDQSIIHLMNKIGVSLEIGPKRTFASAVDWPGWCRIGRDEQTALQALLDYGPRYERIVRPAARRNEVLRFLAPEGLSAFVVVERVEGNSTTDFGAPNVPLSRDEMPVDEAAHQRFENLLKACWQAFDEAVRHATGKELRKGPRGGGRDLEGIVRHVLGGDAGYLSQLGWKFKREKTDSLEEELRQTRDAILEGLAAAVRGELPARGPRGGARWKPPTFVRRVAWHVLDHVWEIEDRIL